MGIPSKPAAFALAAITFSALFRPCATAVSGSAGAPDQLFDVPLGGGDRHPWSVDGGSLPVSDLIATGPDGKPVDIARRPGWKVVYFWSAECPCVRACEEYTLKPLAAKYAGKVSFYAVDAGAYDLNNDVAVLRAQAAAHKLPYPVLLDRDHKITRGLGAQVTPQVFLINPDDRIVFSGMPDDSKRYLKLTGKHAVTETYLSSALEQALAGKPVTRSRTELEGCLIAW